MTAPLAFGTFTVPGHWQCIDLISDLHLQASEMGTFEALEAHLLGTCADAVLLLGDVFEVWVGDDAAAQDPFLRRCTQLLQRAGQRLHLGFMHGNRDFLLGSAQLQQCHMHALQDPTVLQWGRVRTLLSHGDALCLGDVAYQRFRALARTAQWQADFLARPLPERLALAHSMRAQSQAHNLGMSDFADADPDLTCAWLQACGSLHLIHGHTHRPADHRVPGCPGALRQVLSDWHITPTERRAQVLRLYADGATERLLPQLAAVP